MVIDRQHSEPPGGYSGNRHRQHSDAIVDSNTVSDYANTTVTSYIDNRVRASHAV